MSGTICCAEYQLQVCARMLSVCVCVRPPCCRTGNRVFESHGCPHRHRPIIGLSSVPEGAVVILLDRSAYVLIAVCCTPRTSLSVADPPPLSHTLFFSPPLALNFSRFLSLSGVHAMQVTREPRGGRRGDSWSVLRRYSDFSQLYDHLPRELHAPMPPKSWRSFSYLSMTPVSQTESARHRAAPRRMDDRILSRICSEEDR